MNGSPSSSNIDKLGVYLLVSLFFVVATMLEFAIALLVKRNPRRFKKMLKKTISPGMALLHKSVTSISQLMTDFDINNSKGRKVKKRRSSKDTKIQNLEDPNDKNGDGRININLS